MGPSPWTTIWFKPKEAFEQLKSRPPTYMWWLFAFILSLNTHVRLAAVPTKLGSTGLIIFALLSIIVATCVTWCLFYVGAFILWKVSGWFKGGASFDDSKRVYVWSRIPFLISSILLAVLLFSAGFRQGLTGGGASAAGGGMIVPSWVTIVLLAAVVWWLFIYVKGLMHINGFGAAKAWGTLIITAVVSLIILLFVMFLIALVVGGISGLIYS